MSTEPRPPLPLYVDSTMLTSFRSCPRSFYWRHVLGLNSPGASIHLVAGGAFAAGLDAARRAQFSKSNTQLSVDELLEAAIGPFMSEWIGIEPEVEHAKNFHNTFLALEEYLSGECHPFADPVQPLRKADGTPTTEFTFAIPLPIKHPSGEPFIFVGRFDMLGKFTDHDLLCIVDEKTTSSLGYSWTNQWDMRGQFLGYCWACNQLGYKLNDVIVRGIGLLKTEIKFLTAPINYPNHLIERWYDQTIYTLGEMKAAWELDHWNYSFGEACTSYGICPYVDLCKHREPSQWFSNYEVSHWNPLHADTT